MTKTECGCSWTVYAQWRDMNRTMTSKTAWCKQGQGKQGRRGIRTGSANRARADSDWGAWSTEAQCDSETSNAQVQEHRRPNRSAKKPFDNHIRSRQSTKINEQKQSWVVAGSRTLLSRSHVSSMTGWCTCPIYYQGVVRAEKGSVIIRYKLADLIKRVWPGTLLSRAAMFQAWLGEESNPALPLPCLKHDRRIYWSYILPGSC